MLALRRLEIVQDAEFCLRHLRRAFRIDIVGLPGVFGLVCANHVPHVRPFS